MLIAAAWAVAATLLAVVWAAIAAKRRERDELVKQLYDKLGARSGQAALSAELRRRIDEDRAGEHQTGE